MDEWFGGSLSLKILKDHLVEGLLEPGELSIFSPDLIMGHDVTAPPAISMINRGGLPYLKAADRSVIYLDHFTPPKDRESAEACRMIREFNARYRMADYVDWGEGICHVHLFEGERVHPGDMIIGADSHITTGGAIGAYSTAIGSTDLAVAMASGEVWLEIPKPVGVLFEGIPDVWSEGKDIGLRLISWFGSNGASGQGLEMDGKIIEWMADDSRFTIANLACETSASVAIFPDRVDKGTYGPRAPRWEWETKHVDIEGMGPQVAIPGSPNRVEPVENVGGKAVDQIFVGSCTNGRLDDLRVLAKVLKGRTKHPDVRLLVIPGSRLVFQMAERAGYIKTIMDAGGVVSMPTCGPCAGGFLGILPAGEVAISTTNRNFRGRMGDPTSKIYLSGAAVAGASAIAGIISHPEEVVS